MSYVLRGLHDDCEPIERRVDTALRALVTYVAYARADRYIVPILDDAGAKVSLAQLLAEANRDAGDDAAARRRVISVLADLVATFLRPCDDAVPSVHPPDIYWHQAGRSWAVRFDQEPPRPLLDELADRFTYPRCKVLVAGAEEVLAGRPGTEGTRETGRSPEIR